MRKTVSVFIALVMYCGINYAQYSDETIGNSSANILQYYSLKAGYYNPQHGLNNGLIFGLDGITEFNKYNLFLSGNIDFYQKKTINIYDAPDITSQSLLLFPLHINIGYKIAAIKDAGTTIFAGIGGGYYLYFYKGTYQTTSSDILFQKKIDNNVSRNSGNGFFTVFVRILIGGIFIEPMGYFASEKNDKINGYSLKVNPSGFSIMMGFQY